MKHFQILLCLLFLGCISCSTDALMEDALNQIDTEIDLPTETEEPQIERNLYFPPLNSNTWETFSLTELNWNREAETELYSLLTISNTKAFIILKDGKIAVEWYATDFRQNDPWYWASAGKTLTSFTVGIAEEEGYLSVTDESSAYLGKAWTATPPEKEDLITIWHQLTMTTGMDDTRGDCKTPDCLTYLADAGTRWSYHNAPYTLLQDVVSNATRTDFEDYFTQKLKNKIGMTGTWISTNGENNVYWSTARSMARFGLLNLNNGVWENTVILGNETYLNAAKNTSQDLNKSYGYLWWLNGKESAMLPQSQIVFNIPLVPNAPIDMYAGLGKDDQKLYIIPSKSMVIVRMGDETGEPTAGPSSFDNDLWEAINNMID